MLSDDTSRTLLLRLAVPVVLPAPIAEQLRTGKMRPNEFFYVTLTEDAWEQHGLDALFVFREASQVELVEVGNLRLDEAGHVTLDEDDEEA